MGASGTCGKGPRALRACAYGPAPQDAGLPVVQDGADINLAANQNFKLVPWAAVQAALKLE
jgi:myo-inositol-hexaphosphate 3-phosphohydrolase